MNPYEELANAIVLQAVEDYRSNVKRRQWFVLKLTDVASQFPKNEKTARLVVYKLRRKMKSYEKNIDQIDMDQLDIRKFFRSEWYKVLTGIDGEWLLREISEEGACL